MAETQYVAKPIARAMEQLDAIIVAYTVNRSVGLTEDRAIYIALTEVPNGDEVQRFLDGKDDRYPIDQAIAFREDLMAILEARHVEQDDWSVLTNETATMAAGADITGLAEYLATSPEWARRFYEAMASDDASRAKNILMTAVARVGDLAEEQGWSHRVRTVKVEQAEKTIAQVAERAGLASRADEEDQQMFERSVWCDALFEVLTP